MVQGNGLTFLPDTSAPENQSPLEKFSGVLADVTIEEAERKNNDGTTRMVQTEVFDFIEVVPIRVSEPYPFPTAKIRITYTPKRGQNRWAVLAASIRKFAPALGVEPERAFGALQGRKLTMEMLPGSIRMLDEGEWKDKEANCWHLVDIEGVDASGDGKVNVIEYAVGLLEGKTETAFYEQLYQDETIRKWGQELITLASDRKLVSSWATAGLVKQETDGTYRKVGG